MAPKIACRILCDAEGLHAAHELDLVHRDVTPHNLFVAYDGTTKRFDFGAERSTSAPDNSLLGKAHPNVRIRTIDLDPAENSLDLDVRIRTF